MPGSIIWISGASGGLGLGLARTVPYADARIINISRRQSADYETVVADISGPAGWDAVRETFARQLAGFEGERVIFIHNAFDARVRRVSGRFDPEVHQQMVLANAAAPLILGEAFLRATAGLSCEVGLVQLSSGAAARCMDKFANYCAAKIAVEMWCSTVSAELAARGDRRWVAAVRPGAVATPANGREATLPGSPRPPAEEGAPRQVDYVPPQYAGQRIWSALPPPPGVTVIDIGPRPERDPTSIFGNVAYR